MGYKRYLKKNQNFLLFWKSTQQPSQSDGCESSDLMQRRQRRRHWAQQRHHLFICQSVSLWFLWNNSYQHSTACAGCRSKNKRKRRSRRSGCFVSVRLTPARTARLQLWEFLKNAARLVIDETGLLLRPRVAAWPSSSPLCLLLGHSKVLLEPRVCVIHSRDKFSVCNWTGLVVYLNCIYRHT